MTQPLIRFGLLSSWLVAMQACGGGVNLQSVGKAPLTEAGGAPASAEAGSSAGSPGPTTTAGQNPGQGQPSSDSEAEQLSTAESGSLDTETAGNSPGAATGSAASETAVAETTPAETAAGPAVSLAKDSPSPTPAPVASVKEVLASCSSGQRSKRTIQVVFEATTGACQWGQNGNLSARDGVVRARFEQKVELGLPTGELVCEVGITSPSQNIIFDDELLLTFNDIVLLSSFDYTPRLPRNPESPEVESFLYDWGKLLGGVNPGGSDTPPYCLGAGQPGALCTIPQTQTVGSFALALSPRESALLGFSAKTKNTAQVGLIVTGDNDTSQDCKHSRLVLDVTLSTVAQSP